MTTSEIRKIRARVLKERVKWFFLSLPIIKYPRIWYYDYKFYKKLQKMTPWEQHLEIRRVENERNKINFVGDLAVLVGCIKQDNKNEKMFLESKTNLLNNPVILNYMEFKEWLEKIDFTETNDTMARNLFYSFANEEEWNK